MDMIRRVALLLSAILSVGCSGSSPSDGRHGVTPSLETTSSIVRPPVNVGETEAGYPDAGPSRVEAFVENKGIETPAFDKALATRRERPMMAGPRPKVIAQRFGEKKPVNFGKITPQDHLVHGVDVSRWQGQIDWQTLRAQGANFAFIKATDGGDYVDPMFRKNWVGAKEAGIKRGAYHLLYWCRPGEEQAEWFIRNVPKEVLALPPVVDVEWNYQSRCKQKLSPAQVREKMKAFMDRLERHYGQRPIIYATPDFYDDNLDGYFTDYPFWVRSVAAYPSKRYPKREWVFWQYSGTGLSKGVAGGIDLNVFRGDKAAWYRWLARNAMSDTMARN